METKSAVKMMLLNTFLPSFSSFLKYSAGVDRFVEKLKKKKVVTSLSAVERA